MDPLSLPLEEVIKMEKENSFKPRNFEKNHSMLLTALHIYYKHFARREHF